MTEPNAAGRRIVRTGEAPFRPFDRYGKRVPGLTWLDVSYDDASGHGCFLVRFAPGARSLPHEHTGIEEFLVLEGELVDSDGSVFRRGDFVSFPPGSRHWSEAPGGCLIAIFLRGANRLIDDG